MSKQSEAKQEQQYIAQPRACKSCVYLTCQKVLFSRDWKGNEHYVDKNLRCLKGGFAVKKMSSCAQWSPAPTV